MAIQKNRHGVTISDAHWKYIQTVARIRSENGIGQVRESTVLTEIIAEYVDAHPVKSPPAYFVPRVAVKRATNHPAKLSSAV